MYKALLLIPFLCSCAPQFVRIEGGAVVDSGWGEEVIDRLNLGRHFDVARINGGVVWENYLADWFSIDTGFLASSTFIVGDIDKTQGIGAEFQLRPRLDFGVIEPYVIGTAGCEYYFSRIGIQNSQHGFPLTFGAGVRFDFNPFYITTDYRILHESNGADFLGDSLRPNPGYNDDVFMVGLEYRF